MQKIPAGRGTYALLLFCPRSRTLGIGRLGSRTIPRGWYVYVGSAFGPGGLRARCRRHLRPPRRRHWHIDYLRPAAILQAIWFTEDPEPQEHRWAEIVGSLAGAEVLIRRFGSSDCRCPSHLFRCASRPSFATFRRLALRGVPAPDRTGIFSAAMPRQACRDAL
ncbi:MAG: GIY-YIG nuclease family protein [Desulfobacterales bacterium]|nr:GIY-YIG nuclease family protein [Desulfobacterales bacterium]